MKVGQRVLFAAMASLCAMPVSADTIISFTEVPGAVQVSVDGTKVGTVSGESADTTHFTDPGFFSGPLGRRLCFTCPTGIFGALLFEPGTSETSDFIVASVVFGGAPGTVDTDIFFASDPDIAALAAKFNRGQDLLNVLTTKVAPTPESGGEQTLQFYDLNGVVTALPSGPAIPFLYTGGSIIVKATSDIEVLEPSSVSLLAPAAILLASIRRRRAAK